ncbi:MAG TPA: hypothetical protein VK595_14655 [Vicinamibacterales bacterium]|nr:hypothetical protein [Vicinamibacterales bacterium]
MRRVTAILSVAAVVLMAAGLLAQAKPGFAGEWKLVADQGLGEPGIDLTITQSATAMTVEYRAGGQAPAPVKLTYTLDGAVSKNMMAGRGGGAPTEQVSKALWVANKLVVTTTTGAGEEKRTFSMEGDNLVVETSAPARSGGAPNITKVTYKRYERGHGG